MLYRTPLLARGCYLASVFLATAVAGSTTALGPGSRFAPSTSGTPSPCRVIGEEADPTVLGLLSSPPGDEAACRASGTDAGEGASVGDVAYVATAAFEKYRSWPPAGPREGETLEDCDDIAPASELVPSAFHPVPSRVAAGRTGSPSSDPFPSRVFMSLYGYDSFRGVPLGGWGVYGGHVGFNCGTRLGRVSDWTGIGLQIGATFGVFSWAGTDYQMRRRNEAELQGFVSYGLFRKATESCNWSGGVAQDWMFNDNFSVFAQNPTLSQLRMQLGYATGRWDEIGVWAAVRVLDDTRTVNFFGPTTWRPVNHVKAYWHHKWHHGGPDTWIALGIPEQTRLTGGGSLGDWLASATAMCPLSDSFSLYANVMYMNQSASAGDAGAQEDAWNFTTGIAFYPGGHARSSTVAGQRWSPLFPVANNGSFLVDASNWY